MSSEVCEALKRARERGDWVEVWKTLIEGLDPIEDWDSYSVLLHRDIPQALREVLGECGVGLLGLYHLKDDVQLPEYVAEICFGDGVYTAEFDVDIDTEAGVVTLLAVRLVHGMVSGLLPYYHVV